MCSNCDSLRFAASESSRKRRQPTSSSPPLEQLIRNQTAAISQPERFKNLGGQCPEIQIKRTAPSAERVAFSIRPVPCRHSGTIRLRLCSWFAFALAVVLPFLSVIPQGNLLLSFPPRNANPFPNQNRQNTNSCQPASEAVISDLPLSRSEMSLPKKQEQSFG